MQRVVLDPAEVVASGGVGWRLLGEEVSERVAFAPASFFRLQLVRRTWSRVAADGAPAVVTAPLPAGVWPRGVFLDDSAGLGFKGGDEGRAGRVVQQCAKRIARGHRCARDKAEAVLNDVVSRED